MLSKGGFFMFMTMLSLVLMLNGVMTSLGLAARSCSALVFDTSFGNDTSTWPVWSAAIRVPGSLMTMYLSPSR